MTPGIKRVIIDFLNEYSERLSNDGCNDWKWPKYLNESDRKLILKHIENVDEMGYKTNSLYGPGNWEVVLAIISIIEQ
jgi:hypothetical protein